MRIAYLSASGQRGGAETCLLDVLASLRAAAPSWPLLLVSAGDGPFVDRARSLGVSTAVVPFPPAVARLGETGTVAAAGPARFAAEVGLAAGPIAAYAADLRRAIAPFAPDVVHTNGLKMHLLGTYAAGDAPVVWHVHDYVSARRVSSRLLRWTANRCAAVIANSESVAADARNALGDGVAVAAVLNAVDLDRFSPEGDVLDLDRLAGLPPAPAGTVRVGLPATFARWKGQPVFIEAIAALASMPVRAYVIGGPVYDTDRSQFSLDELRDLAERRGVRDRVGFTGFVDRPDAALRALDVVVHASTSPEPFGLVIAEAMACGRAVIVSNAGGAAELVAPGRDALTCIPGDAVELTGTIAALTADPACRSALGRAARATAVRRFDRSRLARDLMPIYAAVGARQAAATPTASDSR